MYMLSNTENFQQAIINGLVVDKHNDIKNKGQQDLYNSLEQSKQQGQISSQQSQIERLDSNVGDLRRINNSLRKDIQTKEGRIKELEGLVLAQTIALDEAFNELFIQIEPTEEKKQLAKKQLEKFKFRTQQIIDKKTEELKALKEVEENTPKKLTNIEFDDYFLFLKTFNSVKNKPDMLKQFENLDSRFCYWHARGEYQDIQLPPKQTPKI